MLESRPFVVLVEVTVDGVDARRVGPLVADSLRHYADLLDAEGAAPSGLVGVSGRLDVGRGMVRWFVVGEGEGE
jgi:hypothetical protein